MIHSESFLRVSREAWFGLVIKCLIACCPKKKKKEEQSE